MKITINQVMCLDDEDVLLTEEGAKPNLKMAFHYDTREEINLSLDAISTDESGNLLLHVNHNEVHKYYDWTYNSISNYRTFPGDDASLTSKYDAYELNVCTTDKYLDKNGDMMPAQYVSIWLKPENEDEDELLSNASLVVTNLKWETMITLVKNVPVRKEILKNVTLSHTESVTFKV